MTVEEYVVGLQVHHGPQHLEGSGDVEVQYVISGDGPRTTSSKYPMFSSLEFIPSSY